MSGEFNNKFSQSRGVFRRGRGLGVKTPLFGKISSIC